MSKYINPFTDWGFKKIFGQEANKDIIIFFLNELLKGERHITDIDFLDKERIGAARDDRSLIYDIYCETDTGEHIIVEMQNKKQAHFIDRSVFYLSKSIVEQAEKGRNWDYEVSAVYGVFFLNFETEQLGQKFRTDMILADRDTGKIITDKMRYIYLQLPYFKKKENECESLFDCFIYVLQKMEILDRMPFEKKNFIFSKLEEIAKVRTLSDGERMAYDESLKHYRDSYSVYKTAIMDGLAEGMAKGHAKGLAQGLAEGRAEGRAEGERNKAMEMARKLKAAGIGIAVIAASSGLSPKEIETL